MSANTVEGHGLNPDQTVSLRNMFCAAALQDNIQEGEHTPGKTPLYAISLLEAWNEPLEHLMLEALIASFSRASIDFSNTSGKTRVILIELFIPILAAGQLASRVDLSEQACVVRNFPFPSALLKIQTVMNSEK